MQDPAAFQEEPPPPATERKTLGDFVPPDVISPISDILNAAIEGRMRPEDAVRMLREILEPHREYIEARGNLPDFLAMYLVAALTGKSVEGEPPEPPKRGRKKGRK